MKKKSIDPNIDRFIWKEGDIEIIKPGEDKKKSTKKKAEQKKSKKEEK